MHHLVSALYKEIVKERLLYSSAYPNVPGTKLLFVLSEINGKYPYKAF